jgi:predicted component of type VI protein secretion system
MALTLKLRSGGLEPAPELSFDAPRVVVGRASGCELQLPDPSISLRHASLRQRGSGYVLVDEGSENGTFSDLLRLSRQAPHVLSDGELLRFGRIWVEVRFGPAQPTPDPARAARALARALVEHALEQDEQPSGLNVTLARRGVAQAELRLDREKHGYRVGSAEEADLQLPDEELPERCFDLQRQGDQVWIIRQRGTPEMLLGERELPERERTLWPPGTALRVGPYELRVDDATGQVLDRLEREQTELLAEDAAIDPPEASDEAGDTGELEEFERDPTPSAAEAERLSVGPARRRLPINSGDALVVLFALGVLGLSLWAIRWLSHFGAA